VDKPLCGLCKLRLLKKGVWYHILTQINNRKAVATLTATVASRRLAIGVCGDNRATVVQPPCGGANSYGNRFAVATLS
jgi:hypothetical protein